MRAAFNTVGPLSGATSLPPPGGALRNLTAVHLCVPPTEPAALRALVIDAYNRAAGRERDVSFLNVGLDAADPWPVP